jgi:hypothetical protein
MSFLDKVVNDVVLLGKKHGIEPAALMAVVEVESAGQPFEPADGVTPRFLYERHVMYKELLKRRGKPKADAAVRLDLARIGWDRSTQYKDQRSSAGRLALLARAAAFDKECAYRSCSWGVGQTMGFHAESHGYASAVDMVEAMKAGGIPAQIEAMIKEIKKSKLVGKINAHDWAGFAYRYNGAGYAQNQYDVRMAKAYSKWKPKLVGYVPTAVNEPDPPAPAKIDQTNIELAKETSSVSEKEVNTSAALRQGTIIGGSILSMFAGVEFKLVLALGVVAIAGYAVWVATGKPKFWKGEF